MERISVVDDVFETTDKAIFNYERDNPTRKVVRVGEEDSPIELILEKTGETIQKYLLFNGKRFSVNDCKVGETSDQIKEMDFWPQVEAKFVHESVHLSELVRHLIGPGPVPPRPYFVFTGVPK
jgi:hypothetical protein